MAARSFEATRRRIPLLLLAALAAACCLAQCAREPVSPVSGGMSLVWRMPQAGFTAAAGDSFRLWILDADGRPLRPPTTTAAGPDAPSVDWAIRVPAGNDLGLWLELTRADSSRRGTSGRIRGSIAAGGARGVSIVPGRVTSVEIPLAATVPALGAIAGQPGDDRITLRWSSVRGALDYELLVEQGGKAVTYTGADTFKVIPLRTTMGFAGLATASTPRAAANDTVYYQVRSRLPHGAMSAYGAARGLYLPDLLDLPRVSRCLPADGASGVPDSSVVLLAFSHPMDPASWGDSTVTLRLQASGEAVAMRANWEPGDTVLLLEPVGLLARGTSYRLRVLPELKDVQGRPLDQDPSTTGLQGFESRFTTEIYDPLRVVRADPADGATLVDVRPALRLFLNRKARASSVTCVSGCSNVVLADSTGARVEAAASLEADSVIVVVPRDSLRYFAPYALTATGAVRDLRGRAGEPLDQDPSTPASEPFHCAFRTRPAPPEPVGPRVLWTVPADGEGNAPDDRSVLIRFSRPVQAASVENNHCTVRELPGDAVIPSRRTMNGDRRELTIAPTYNGGLFKPGFRYRIVVTSGVLDDAGITFDQDSTARGRQPFSAAFRAENPPRVRSSIPAAEAVRVPVETSIQLTFSQPIARSTLTASSLTLETGGVQVTRRTLSLSPDSTVLTLTPVEPLVHYRSYTLRADTTIFSTRGSRLDQDSLLTGHQAFTLRFTTRWESLPPQVVSSLPQDGQRDVPANTGVTVRFDHLINPRTVTSATFYLQKMAADSDTVACTRSVSADSIFATLTPRAALAEGATYRVTVTNWIEDRFDTRLDQNRLTTDVREPFVSYFTTGYSLSRRRR